MVVREKLIREAIKSLEEMDTLNPDLYGREKGIFIGRIYSKGILDDSSMISAIERAVFKFARIDYDILMRKREQGLGCFADDVYGPRGFGYSLDKGVFSDYELSRMPFEDGDTLDNFSEKHEGKDFPNTLLKTIFNPKPAPKYAFDFGPEDCDDCVTC